MFSKLKVVFLLLKNKMLLKTLKQDYKAAGRMFQAILKGTYKIIPIGTLLRFIFAVMYLFLLTDLIPDFIPILGQMDDLTAILWFLNSLKQDIEKFKIFENLNQETPPIVDAEV